MKVLFISPVFHGGGAERCARELFELLPGQGIQTAMMVADRKPSDPPGVYGTRLPGEKYLRAIDRIRASYHWRFPGSVLKLGQLRTDDFDVVHLHNINGWISVKAVASLCRRIPAVWTLHDEWAATAGIPYDLTRVMPAEQIDHRFKVPGLRPDEPFSGRLRRFVGDHMPQPRALISPTRYIAGLIEESGRFPGVPTHIRPYGLRMASPETELSQARARESFGLPTSGKVVLLIAAHLRSPYKGAWLALEALQALHQDEAHVLLAGHGGEQMAIGIHQRLTNVGFLSDRNLLAAAYRAADLTLIPSVADNLPYVALESMACKTPIVAFAVGGLRELVGNNERGLLAEPLQATSLAAAMRRLLSNATLARTLASAGYEWVRQHCDMGRFVDSMADIYRAAINAHPVGNQQAFTTSDVGAARAADNEEK